MTEWKRIIVHADMDAFFAAVEQLDCLDLRNKPVLVGGTGRRGVVSTASYEARPFGPRSAMPMEEARRLCPQAVVLEPRFARYKEISADIMAVFGEFSPLVEPLSLDEAFLDMSAATHLFGTPAEMGRQLKQKVFAATGGLTVSVGVAPNKFVAKVASDHQKPDGLTIVEPTAVCDFLWPLDLGHLWGVGPKTRKKLKALGYTTIAEVARASEAQLREQFGSLGCHIHRLAWGKDAREVTPERERKSIGAEYTLEKDIRGAEAIRPHLRRAADRIAARLREKELTAKAVRVKLKTARFRLWTRQRSLPAATASADELFEGAAALLSAFDLSAPMRLVGLAAFDLDRADAPQQQDLFDRATRRRRQKLDQTLDALKKRFGQDSVHRGSDLK